MGGDSILNLLLPRQGLQRRLFGHPIAASGSRAASLFQQAILLAAILKILRTGFAEQRVSSNMIMKTFLAHPFGREGMDMALPGTLTRTCFRSLSKYLPEERPTSQRRLSGPCSMTTTERDVQLRSACPQLGAYWTR